MMRPSALLATIVDVRFPQLLLVSAAAWAVMLLSTRGFITPTLCSAGDGAWLTRSADGVAAAFTFRPPTAEILPWLVMLLAMMPPLLTQPVAYLWDRSFSRRRWRAIGLFVGGYGAIWTLAGIGLMATAILISELSRQVRLPVVIPSIVLALLWQCSPAKQMCLNRCHRQPRLSAFGLAADMDSLRYGLSSAVWCVGTCWTLMLIPLIVQSMHLLAMAVVSVLLLAERLAEARPARWRWPLPFMP
jgi:predicted metal-binding membrane protein